ncbi:hypothetical protein swp_3968 [Shewanella piezotolerans WP3]|uniref:Uncharacterized protein n=1 Tax=Shewanella piezotolerans (strain WP3 / JCM 13877) TaxID=225849 RepID=B8CSL2_SHEPW|nr:hypothetical protein swp_3968 [Shewanella piezotolerans WP3]
MAQQLSLNLSYLRNSLRKILPTVDLGWHQQS